MEMMSQIEESFNQQRQFVEDASHELRTTITNYSRSFKFDSAMGKKDPAVLEESLTFLLKK